MLQLVVTNASPNRAARVSDAEGTRVVGPDGQTTIHVGSTPITVSFEEVPVIDGGTIAPDGE